MPLPITYSHSKLETFTQCKLKYKFRYIEKIPVEIPTTIEAFMGSLVHQTLLRLYQIAQIRTPELKELLEFYHLEWKKNWDPNILITKSDKTKQDYKQQGEKYLIDYYFTHRPFNQSQTLALETQEVIPLNKIYSYHIRIDRLAENQGLLEIHDYKTGNLKTQEELDQDKQLAMYSLWVKNKFPDIKKIKLIWHFLAFNKDFMSERTESQLLDLKLQTLEKIREIESTTEFPPSPSPLCSYCEFQEICPELKLHFKNS